MLRTVTCGDYLTTFHLSSVGSFSYKLLAEAVSRRAEEGHGTNGLRRISSSPDGTNGQKNKIGKFAGGHIAIVALDLIATTKQRKRNQ